MTRLLFWLLTIATYLGASYGIAVIAVHRLPEGSPWLTYLPLLGGLLGAALGFVLAFVDYYRWGGGATR